MTWREGYGLLRLLDEEKVGAPGRLAERAWEEEKIAEMRRSLPDMRG